MWLFRCNVIVVKFFIGIVNFFSWTRMPKQFLLQHALTQKTPTIMLRQTNKQTDRQTTWYDSTPSHWPSTRVYCDMRTMTGICGFQLRLELRSAGNDLRLLLRTNISHHPTSEEGRSGPWSKRCRGNHVTWSRCWARGRSYRWPQAVSYRDECSSDNDRSYRLLHRLLGSRIDCQRYTVTDGLITHTCYKHKYCIFVYTTSHIVIVSVNVHPIRHWGRSVSKLKR